MTERKKLKPLGFFGAILLPIALLFLRGEAALRLKRRGLLRQAILKHNKELRQAKKELAVEAHQYAEMVIHRLAALGEAWVPREYDPLTKMIRGRSRRQVHHVQFARIYTSAELIWFQILVGRRTLFGYKSALPYRVTVGNITSEETLYELSHTIRRKVAAAVDDPRMGAWFVVHRLEGVGGLPKLVSFRSMLAHWPADMSTAPIVLGSGEHRKIHTVEFASHPHALIGGSSGSGKSNEVNVIIAGLMRFSSPDDIKFVLIDLKRMEFVYYKDAPHLLMPIIVDPDVAIQVLDDLVGQVRMRAELLSDKAKELGQWNQKYPDKKLPRIFVVIDEFAELMLASGPKVARATENAITRLTNLGRAVGIHVIVCTQRPAVSVLPNSIKINMPLIISGRTQSATQSRVIINNGEAANLPMIKGRMLYTSGSDMFTIQTPFISDDDVLECVRIARGRAAGVITLEGVDPVIEPAGLIRYILKACDGAFSLVDLASALRVYCITKMQVKAFVEEVVKVGKVAVGETIYKVDKVRGGSYRLTFLSGPVEQPDPVQADPIPTGGFWRIERVPLLERPIPAPRWLMLPAPAAIPVEIDPVKRFIDCCCIVGPDYENVASELYNGYVDWCSEQGIKPITNNAFGRTLNKLGFPKRETRMRNFRVGLILADYLQKAG